jgi:hypothetical protein
LFRLSTVVVLATILTACAPKSLQTPEGKHAYTADQIAKRLGEFQNAVIDASSANKIPLADARTIVTWISGDQHATPPVVGALTILKVAPDGWQAVVLSGWQRVHPLVDRNPTLATWSGVIDALLEGLH